ncbi:hypothetical protein M9H77_02606 [Catharanthus roseus]|uniref:Uncharacterized protein n=1 Tax=Catharanthus roseus TaxID=4058 RepID=A0ACC0C8V3_CATRO|nr:hypothetical protein M9H77_02606 [Catharanthus roseus]
MFAAPLPDSFEFLRLLLFALASCSRHWLPVPLMVGAEQRRGNPRQRPTGTTADLQPIVGVGHSSELQGSARERKSSTGAPRIITFTTFNHCGCSRDEKKKEWIPPSEEDRLRDRNFAGFRSIKKTTQTGI